jgi:biotin operon repressor
MKMTDDLREDALRLLKALADPNRLKIVGLLAKSPHSVEDIAHQLHISGSTASHHLARLATAGLVSARAKGYYSVYSLHTEEITALAKTFLKTENLPSLAPIDGTDAYDRKVLAAFTTPEGAITKFPVQEKKLLVLLRHVLKDFEPGTEYPEKRVNQILSKYSEDTARLRRSLVEYGFMAREGGGGKYWRL